MYKINKSDGIFKKIFETTPDAIVLINAETFIIEEINPSLIKLLGLNENNIIGSKLKDLKLFSDSGFWDTIIEELKSKSFVRYENSIITIDPISGARQKIYVEILGYVFEFNSIRYLKLHIRDETERLRMEENLRHSELSLKEAQHQAKIGSWTWKPKTDEPVWSEEMYQIFGMDPKQPAANFKEVPNLYTPESWQLLNAAVQKTLQSGEPYELDTQIVKQNGTLIWATCRGEAIRDQEGNVVSLRGSIQDINDRKVAENLEIEAEMLKRASNMKSMFLANMSHELRTPLNSIIGFSEMLKDGLLDSLTERQKKYIEIIYNSGEHLLSLINDILDLSKVESGKMNLDLEPVVINTILSNGISMFNERILKHNITSHIEIEENLETLQADSRKVKQIVYNLLSNAVKFTVDGGNIDLRIGRKSRNAIEKISNADTVRRFELPENEFQEFVEISVSDNGIGIESRDIDNLFQAFSQVDSKLARKYEGTGLGLALVKQMAQLHGGTVMVKSSPGQGSQFTVWLPLRTTFENPRISPEYMVIPKIKEKEPDVKTVLVIEDDDSATELIRLQLENEKLQVLPVKSAEAALELLKIITPDLITLDILLPGMDGWEFLARLKQMPLHYKIPVVIISMVASKNKGIALGANAVLQKPIGRDELRNAIANIGFNGTPREIPYKVIVADDDKNAAEIITGYLKTPEFEVILASNGGQAIEFAHKEKPDLILLELMISGINSMDVVEDLKSHNDTMNIPIVMISTRTISENEKKKLKGLGLNIQEISEINNGSFMNEVRRALAIHQDIQ